MSADVSDLAVVLPTDRDRAALADSPNEYRLHWIDDDAWSYPRPDPSFDMVGYTERCREVVAERDIDGVVYSHDVSNLVAGVLCEEFDLPGPTLEAMFLTDHKYYSRECHPDPPWYDYIDLATGEWGRREAQYPCYVKPPFLTMTLLQHTIDSPAELEAALEVLREELPTWNDMFREFFAGYLDTDRYPLATDDVVLVEERLEDWTQHCVEGWTDHDGQPHLWAISDQNYYSGESIAVDNYTTPSTLPPEVRTEMVDYAFETVDRHGIEGSFWNVEVFRVGDRFVATEVNGRSASVWEQLYEGAFDSSIYDAMLHLGAGAEDRVHEVAPDWRPESPGETVGGQFHGVTFGEGPAEDYVDFEYVESLDAPDIQLFVAPGDTIEQTRTSGVWLARFHLFGDDYHEILDHADEIRGNLLERPAESPEPDRYGG